MPKINSISQKKKSYKKNFLKNVFFRVDFSQVNLNFLEDFYAEIKVLFPFQSKQNGINIFLQSYLDY